MANKLAGQGLGRNMSGKLVTRKSTWQRYLGKSFVDGPVWTKLWRFLCPVWVLTAGWPEQSGVLTVKWEGWSVSLSPANPVISQRACGQGSLGGRAGAAVWTQRQDFHSPRLIWLQVTAWRPTQSTLCGTNSQGDQPASGGRLITLDCCHRRGDRFSL